MAGYRIGGAQSARRLHGLDHLVGAGEQRDGTSRPSAFALRRLITSSSLLGCCTGKSAGFAPPKYFVDIVACASKRSGKFAPYREAVAHLKRLAIMVNVEYRAAVPGDQRG